MAPYTAGRTCGMYCMGINEVMGVRNDPSVKFCVYFHVTNYESNAKYLCSFIMSCPKFGIRLNYNGVYSWFNSA